MEEVKYLELLREQKIAQLEELLVEEIRKGTAIKSNKTSRISAIKSLQKYNEKYGRSNLTGCGSYDSKYSFTDSYMVFILNDNLGYEVNEKMPDLKYLMNRYLSNKELIYIDCKTLMEYVNLKENYRNDYFKENISFDYKRLKSCISIMGKDCKLYASEDKNAIIFINEKEEIGLLLGARKY